MMGLIDDLGGGFNKLEPIKQKNTDTVYIKFDDDTELILYKNVNADDDVLFILDSENNEYLFECPKTGKKFKLYRK
jgi:hypothetical protein